MIRYIIVLEVLRYDVIFAMPVGHEVCCGKYHTAVCDIVKTAEFHRAPKKLTDKHVNLTLHGLTEHLK